MVATAAKYRLNAAGGRSGMDVQTLFGAILIAACAAVVLRGLERTASAARKGRKWDRAYLVGLSVGCAFGVGMVLSIKNSLPKYARLTRRTSLYCMGLSPLARLRLVPALEFPVCASVVRPPPPIISV
jgi:hypothetical protein